jgi:hypothetical protein
MEQVGRLFILLGVIFLFLGLLFIFFSKLNISFPLRLPGDIFIQKDKFSFYFPLTTCIVLSLVFSLLFFLFSKK